MAKPCSMGPCTVQHESWGGKGLPLTFPVCGCFCAGQIQVHLMWRVRRALWALRSCALDLGQSLGRNSACHSYPNMLRMPAQFLEMFKHLSLLVAGLGGTSVENSVAYKSCTAILDCYACVWVIYLIAPLSWPSVTESQPDSFYLI